MYKAKIFLVGKDEEDWTPMEETDYEAEDVLQKALELYPDLLAGDQINPENPRRWLLVAREMGVPGEIDAADRWSLDHLFLDQDGRPTFVECKRASDTRARREVVAQMLDYAANGTTYWNADRLRQSAAETANTRGKSLDDQIRQLVQDELADIEAFWQKVEENLKQGNVRLIFVADDISQELRRLVDFLDRKMTDADVRVLAIEIKQFKGKNQRAMVPRIIGRTEGDPDGTTPSKLTRTRFLERCPLETRASFEMVLARGVERGHSISWGKAFFSVRAILPKGPKTISFAYGGLNGEFQVYLGELPIPQAENDALRKQLMVFGIFREAGGKTLGAKLDAKAIAKLPEVYEFLLGKMDEIVKEY
jgi:hypothetical protein